MINEFLRYAYNSQGCKVSEMTQMKRPSLIKTGFLAVTSKPLLLIPDPLGSNTSGVLDGFRLILMDLGSVINDCGDKHYNKGVSLGYLYVMQWEATSPPS